MASSSSAIASLSPHHSHRFTPIEEGNEDEEISERNSVKASESTDTNSHGYNHRTTPFHPEKNSSKGFSRKLSENDDTGGVLCSKCRPGNREKISVVPVETNGAQRPSMASPNVILKSILASLAPRKSPKSSSLAAAKEEHWKVAVAELSNKLIQATRKRDEAILEASKLKYSMAELEKKLNKLEIYCHGLKSQLEDRDQYGNCLNSACRVNYLQINAGDQDKVIEHFVVLVSEARSSVGILSRALAFQLRQMGSKVCDRISLLLQPYNVKISHTSRGLLYYMEALLNSSFFEDFESVGFEKNAPNMVLNLIDHCEANFAMFSRLQGLTWDEVLSKGTRHFCEDFSKFCDRKMSEIVAMLGWNRAWSEPLLQAFFGASKAVWLVHLVANSVHPSLPIFRVDKGAVFDTIYMEDVGGDKGKKLIPNMVRIMVTPGFYVYNNVIKCKVLCRYCNSNIGDPLDKGFSKSYNNTPTPPII